MECAKDEMRPRHLPPENPSSIVQKSQSWMAGSQCTSSLDVDKRKNSFLVRRIERGRPFFLTSWNGTCILEQRGGNHNFRFFCRITRTNPAVLHPESMDYSTASRYAEVVFRQSWNCVGYFLITLYCTKYIFTSTRSNTPPSELYRSNQSQPVSDRPWLVLKLCLEKHQ